MSDVLRAAFSFRGRLGRLSFWGRHLAGVAIYLATVFVAAGTALVGLAVPPFFWVIVTLLMALAILFVVLSAWTRRLHDRDRSGWWLLGYGFLVLGPNTATDAMRLAGWAVPDAASAASDVMAVVTLAVASIDLGCLRGTRGPNRFGDDPVEPGRASRAELDAF